MKLKQNLNKHERKNVSVVRMIRYISKRTNGILIIGNYIIFTSTREL